MTHDPTQFTYARRADTGELVYIPKSHLDVFPGAFTTDGKPAATKPTGKTKEI